MTVTTPFDCTLSSAISIAPFTLVDNYIVSYCKTPVNIVMTGICRHVEQAGRNISTIIKAGDEHMRMIILKNVYYRRDNKYQAF